MTDIKKAAKDKGPAKTKKSQLNKETLKDLTAEDSEQVKGGQPVVEPAYPVPPAN